jgi:hypothetical protein
MVRQRTSTAPGAERSTMLILAVPQRHDNDPILKLRIDPESNTAADASFHYQLVDADGNVLIAGSGRPGPSIGK